MEHRWYSRIQTSVPVIIHIRDIGKFKYRVLNISQGGIFLEQENATLNGAFRDIKHAFVTVEFNESAFSTMVPALILRDSGKYAALMFTTTHPELHSFLRKLKQQQEMVATPNEGNEIQEHAYPAVKKMRKVSNV